MPEARPHVMIVDDDVVVRYHLAAYLRDCGWPVVEASSSEEALTFLAAENLLIDVFLVAAELRGSHNGFELARKIRAGVPSAKVVLAGSVASAADVAADICDDGPVARPYDPQIIVERIRRFRAGESDRRE